MKSDEFEARMRLGECFHSLRVPPGAFIVIRVDGRSFSRLTERLAEKPFDTGFHEKMVKTASALLESLEATYVFTESDEISALLRRDTRLFDREVEKLVSIGAARASATLSLLLGEVVEFDARIWVGADEASVVDYFMWRQADAARCALNGWAYWTLRKDGKSSKIATEMLDGAPPAEKHAILRARGVDFDAVPEWQKRGTGIHWDTYEKDGHNPKTGKAVKTTRRRIVTDDALPAKEAYSRFVRKMIG